MFERIPAHVRAQAVPAAIEAASTALPMLKRNPRAAKAVGYILAAQTVYKAAQTLRGYFQKPEENWTVTVKSDDSLYETALDLLNSQVEQNWQAIEAELSYVYDEDEDEVREVPAINARPSERVERTLVLDGHEVFAYVDNFAAKKPTPMPVATGGMRLPVAYATPEVVFVADSETGQKAVLEALRQLAIKNQKQRKGRKPQLYTSGGYRGWNRAGDLPVRPVESVAVTDGQVQAVVDDIETFRAMEPEYLRRGVPFHRGYLLFGPPGTGKTSAVKAIAHATESDLYAANLGTLNDAGLAELVQSVSKSKNGAILLLEDIDSFDAARQRDEDDEGDETGQNAGISTTGLLNALDGVETPHGLITILTTNHPEFLDDALVRPGRVDKKVHFGYPDDATVVRHFTYFFGREPRRQLFAAGRSGAELNEVFVAHMTDPEGAEEALSRRALHIA